MPADSYRQQMAQSVEPTLEDIARVLTPDALDYDIAADVPEPGWPVRDSWEAEEDC